jgi:O-methyltransferase involved in polyketide biosynthesis
MSDQTIDLQTCSLSMDDTHIVQLHIYHDEILEPEKIHEIFDTIHSKFPEGKTLLVTADNKATLSQEARDLVSSGNVTEQILADGIVTKHYSHQMAANFFVRYNQPQRPTKLFKTEEEAREWLRTF